MSSDTSNLGEDLGPKTVAINTTFAALATVAVASRFIARQLKGVGWWFDDWTALLALIWVWAFYGLVDASLHYGLGRHIDVVSPKDQTMILKLLFFYQIFYVLAPLTVKVSALFLYKRVFVTPRFVRFVNIMLWIMAAWGLASFLVSVLNCIPVQAFWTGEGQCIVLRVWVYAYGVVNIMLDFLVWLMPIPLIWQLQLSLQQRVALTFVFTLGLADCAAAIVRLAVTGSSFGAEDFTYAYTAPQWWCIIHPCLGILAICLPTMRVFLLKITKLYESSAHLSANITQASTVARRNRWLKGDSPYNELNDVGATLSGDTARDVHNNAIAMALRRESEGTATIRTDTGENEIRVTKDVVVESKTPPEISRGNVPRSK